MFVPRKHANVKFEEPDSQFPVNTLHNKTRHTDARANATKLGHNLVFKVYLLSPNPQKINKKQH